MGPINITLPDGRHVATYTTTLLMIYGIAASIVSVLLYKMLGGCL